MINLINKLLADGSLKHMYDAGFIPNKIFLFRSIFLEVDKYVRLGYGITDAVTFTADKMRISERYVWVALKKMKYENSDTDTDTRE